MRVANLIELPARVAKPRWATRARGVFLAPEETLAVLRAAKQRGAPDHAMILLAYRHGLRASEVCGLRLADADLKDGGHHNPAAQGLPAHRTASLRAPRAAIAR